MTSDIHALVGAYALDAVDDIERASFDRHIRDCESCRTELDELREVAARLADSTWSVPPPRLREDVMAAIGRTRQLSPAEPVREKEKREAARWRRLTAVAAAVVAAVGVGSTVYVVQDHRVQKQQQIAEAAEASEARVRAILAAPDLVVHEKTLTTGGRVTVASSALHNSGVILLAADSALAQNRVYQLWTVTPGVSAPQNAGVLDPGQSAIVQIVNGLPSASDVGVTVEPVGGSKTPTQPMVADVKL
jgi:anti-sigma-K factor RskA